MRKHMHLIGHLKKKLRLRKTFRRENANSYGITNGHFREMTFGDKYRHLKLCKIHLYCRYTCGKFRYKTWRCSATGEKRNAVSKKKKLGNLSGCSLHT